MSTFQELGISKKIIQALTENRIVKPSEIQQKVIPILMGGKTDLVGQAPTGTGKTAAFGIPILQKIKPNEAVVQTLILCPTRELGIQIKRELFRYTKYTEKIYAEAVYGGEKIDKQIASLRRPTHIVVATPGRLIDLVERKAVDLSRVETVVLDEADEMLKRGFKDDLEKILTFTKGKVNIWLFSATMPKGIQDIIHNYLSPDAHRIRVQKDHEVNPDITHEYVLCDREDKLNRLIRFIKGQGEEQGLIFCRTKKTTQTLAKQLEAKGFKVDAMHGDLKQIERDKVMRAFKNKNLQMVVATDISARGIDIKDLAFVCHFEQPDETEYYTHRSGRTARAGKKGISLSFVTNRDLEKLMLMAKTLGIKISGRK
ncbi:MAG: ATP-dependent RNA helicase DeaD [Granulosicoccus sp.]|jgi:ATP-dependent RNA helicase DeaD